MSFRFSPRSWSIRVKSVMLAVGYLLALSAVYGTFTVYVLQREMFQAHDRFQQTAGIVAAQLDAYVASGAERLQTVTRLPGLAYGLRAIQEARGEGYIPPWTTLHYLFFKSPVFSGGVFLLDRAGKVLWTEPPGLPWLGQTLTELVPVAEMYHTRRSLISGMLGGDRLLAQPHVVIGVPIQNDSGELQGILAGEIQRLRANPAAAYFIRRQRVYMPAYRGFITDAELTTLMRYVRWVNAGGWQHQPLDLGK